MNNFGRKASVVIDDNEIKYSDLLFDFEIHFDASSKGNTGSITIYNLSGNSINSIKNGKNIILKAGYRDSFGELIKGSITEIDNKFNNVDRNTTIVISENINEWLKASVNKSWSKNSKASIIAKNIVRESELIIGDIEVGKDIKYTRAKTFSTTIQKALNEIAKDTNSKLHVYSGKVFLRPNNKDSGKKYKLNSNNGLLYTPQKMGKEDNEGENWKIQSLLRYEFKPDDIVKVESDKISGNFRIKDGRHIGNQNDWMTILECVKI